MPFGQSPSSLNGQENLPRSIHTELSTRSPTPRLPQFTFPQQAVSHRCLCANHRTTATANILSPGLSSDSSCSSRNVFRPVPRLPSPPHSTLPAFPNIRRSVKRRPRLSLLPTGASCELSQTPRLARLVPIRASAPTSCSVTTGDYPAVSGTSTATHPPHA